MPMSPEDFIRVWESSATIGQVAEATGQTAQVCSLRAVQYRKKGVPLKCFPRGNPGYDWAALANLARSLKD